MEELSEKALKTLQGIKDGAGFISIKHAGALRSAGLIEQAADVPEVRKPGYTWAKITAAGLARV